MFLGRHRRVAGDERLGKRIARIGSILGIQNGEPVERTFIAVLLAYDRPVARDRTGMTQKSGQGIEPGARQFEAPRPEPGEQFAWSAVVATERAFERPGE